MNQKKEKIKLGEIIKWSFNKVKPYAVKFWLYLFLGLAVVLCNLLVAMFTKQAVGSVKGDMGVFNKTICLLLACLLVQFIVSAINKRLGVMLNTNVAYDLRKKYQEKVMSLSKKCRDELASGDIISRFNHDINVISEYVPGGLYNTIFQVIRAVLAIGYLAEINAVLLVASIVILPGAIYILKKLQVKMGDYFNDDNISRGKSNSVLNETIHNMSFVKSYNLQGKLYGQNKENYGESLKSWIRIHKIFSPILMLTIVLREFPKLICISMGGWLALKGYISIDELIGFVLLLEYIITPITSIPNIIVSLTSAGAAIGRYEEILAMEEERKGGAQLKIDNDIENVLEMKNVHFSYKEGEEVLKNISFCLKRNEHIVIFGESGSGKTSIASLLMGNYPPNSGKILLYGQDIVSISLDSLRSAIALVSQETDILPDTVRENIAFGKMEEVSDDMIREAAALSGATRFIEKLPQKYDTLLQEGETNLSGGQKQTISIARAFLKDAPIVLLDEPTSALDIEMEKIVTDAIKRLKESKSIITISHRFSTMKDADRRIVLKEGNIIDIGTHDELMERCEYYKRIYLADIENGGESA